MTPSKLLKDAVNILKLNSQIIESISNQVLCMKYSYVEVNFNTSAGEQLRCFIPSALYIGQQTQRKNFIGCSKEEEASVYQWLEYCLLNSSHMSNQEILSELNLNLKDSVYLARNNFTIADLLIYLSLHEVYSKLTFQEKEVYSNLSRWFRQVQNETSSSDLYPKIVFTKTKLYT
ncbi:eukaryotic translation elongation factor 1 epsilon-1 isoform X1 [Parasteatoda tepidariorum]|uniref:eukaryotic translation elongation factor 1 epsilon-1 isoform X1 n=1 Tax=Parasteatoda tepidariorum TaxID=114398 RepID=UPI001C725C56|nr:eukaryotic translation elongation factor 1 epsilon-1 isoform X1 [Parasteatoda tepidariorum]